MRLQIRSRNCSILRSALFVYFHTAPETLGPRVVSTFIEERATELELELELIQTQMTQKPMLRAEVRMRMRCANKASAE